MITRFAEWRTAGKLHLWERGSNRRAVSNHVTTNDASRTLASLEIFAELR
jgi:hypothetical protein